MGQLKAGVVEFGYGFPRPSSFCRLFGRVLSIGHMLDELKLSSPRECRPSEVLIGGVDRRC